MSCRAVARGAGGAAMTGSKLGSRGRRLTVWVWDTSRSTPYCGGQASNSRAHQWPPACPSGVASVCCSPLLLGKRICVRAHAPGLVTRRGRVHDEVRCHCVLGGLLGCDPAARWFLLIGSKIGQRKPHLGFRVHESTVLISISNLRLSNQACEASKGGSIQVQCVQIRRTSLTECNAVQWSEVQCHFSLPCQTGGSPRALTIQRKAVPPPPPPGEAITGHGI